MRRSLILLHVSIFLWGFTGIFGRAIDLTTGILVWYRLLLTSICWLFIAFITKKVTWLPRKEIMRMSWAGLLVALHWLCFYGSIKYSNISVGMSCLALIAVFSAIMEPIMMKQKFSWVELLLALFAATGIFLIFSFHEVYRTGIILGICSALLGSCFTIQNRKLMQRHNSETVTTYELCSGLIALTLLMPIYLWLFPTDKYLPDQQDWVLLILFTIVCTVIPFNLSIKALSHVSAFTFNLSLNMEPVYGIILAFIFFHEQKELNTEFYFGTLMILSSVAFYMVYRFRHHITTMIKGREE